MAKASDHPLPQRLSHWINLINFIALIITGFLIHFPFQGMNMELVRNIHFFFMYFLIFNGIVRVYYACFGKYRDYKEFLPNKLDIKTFIPQLKYYLFLGEHPKTNKYNPLQKMAYLAMFFLALVQIVTGFILYWPTKFLALTQAFGGIAAVRGIHYVVMWLFIALIVVHMYLVFTQAFEQVRIMFFGEKKDKKGISGKSEKASV